MESGLRAEKWGISSNYERTKGEYKMDATLSQDFLQDKDIYMAIPAI